MMVKGRGQERVRQCFELTLELSTNNRMTSSEIRTPRCTRGRRNRGEERERDAAALLHLYSDE